MSLTSGFFNSIRGDRGYDAEEMSAIFDGIITTGIFANIGECFKVKAVGGNDIAVGSGKAWFNSKWILNDSDYLLNAGLSDDLANRIDAVVIEVNLNDDERKCYIKMVKGIPGNVPENPKLICSDGVYQYAIAYVLRKAGSESISQDDITSVVGTMERPYIKGLLEPNKALFIYDNYTEDVDLVNLIKDDWNSIPDKYHTYSANFIYTLAKRQMERNMYLPLYGKYSDENPVNSISHDVTFSRTLGDPSIFASPQPSEKIIVKVIKSNFSIVEISNVTQKGFHLELKDTDERFRMPSYEWVAYVAQINK